MKETVILGLTGCLVISCYPRFCSGRQDHPVPVCVKGEENRGKVMAKLGLIAVLWIPVSPSIICLLQARLREMKPFIFF